MQPCLASGVQMHTRGWSPAISRLSMQDALNGALAKAQEAADPDVAVKLATEAWVKFSTIPVGERT
jgi:hypothetical protein